jgi:putative aldouronate transport system permease protein
MGKADVIPQKRGMSIQRLKRYIPLYLMLLPGIIYFVVNNYLPMAGLALAFKKVNYAIGFFNSPWIGFDNFTFLFSSNDAFIIFRNTILYNLAFIILGNLLGVFIAIGLDAIRNKFFQRSSQVIILIPFLLSTVIITYIVFAFLSGKNGFMNMTVLPMLGIDPVSWYNDSKYWPFILTMVYLWMTMGYSSILYYSTLIGIDKSFYEAASIDGSGIWSQIIHITLPSLKPTIIILILLAIGRICYSDFGLFYQVPMNSGLLYSTTQTVDTFVYRALLNLNDIGRATAGGFLQSILGFAFVFTANAVVSKFDKDSRLF